MKRPAILLPRFHRRDCAVHFSIHAYRGAGGPLGAWVDVMFNHRFGA